MLGGVGGVLGRADVPGVVLEDVLAGLQHVEPLLRALVDISPAFIGWIFMPDHPADAFAGSLP